MEKDERLSLFKRELSYIADGNLRNFTENLIADADDYFFTVPASSSGKYHPDFARGNGGLVRHTKAVAYFVNEFMRSELQFGSISEHTAELLIVAAIAHDIKKQGDGLEGHTVKEHPFYAAEYVRAEQKKYSKLISKDDAEYIASIVHTHMGPWCEPKPKTREQLMVYYADYIASRKEIIGLDFIGEGAEDDFEVMPLTVKPKMTVDEYVFDFGKTNGKTIKESYAENPGYIKWIANKDGFNNAEVQNLVKEFLKTI